MMPVFQDISESTSSGLQGENEIAEEETNLIERKKCWTRMDKILLVFGILVYFGDGVAMYLPGVITQQVSCAIGLSVSSWEERLLDCIMYITSVVSIAISEPLADRFGGRTLMLFSMYLSVLSSIACAVVANFAMLAISRALVGVCVGLNISVNTVIIAERLSDESLVDDIFMMSSTMFTMGGVWSAVLGYFLLDKMSWRFFIPLTSTPLFIPVIIMLHTSFKEVEGEQTDQHHHETKQHETVTVTHVPNFIARTVKVGLFGAVSLFRGWLTILLAPALIQLLNIEKAKPNSDCSVTVTKGVQLLLLGLVTFAAIPGRLFLHFIRKKISFRKLQVIVALLNVGTFPWMLAQESLITIAVTNFIVKFLYGVTDQAFVCIWVDVEYFGTAGFARGNSIAIGMVFAGGLVAMVMLAFAPLSSVIITALVISALQILLVLSMTEVNNRR